MAIIALVVITVSVIAHAGPGGDLLLLLQRHPLIWLWAIVPGPRWALTGDWSPNLSSIPTKTLTRRLL